MNKRINVTLFISFFTGFSVLLGNISFLPAFADYFYSFTIPSSALEDRPSSALEDIEQENDPEIQEQVLESVDTVDTNVNTAVTSQDPYRQNADAAAMQRYLMNNQNDSYPFKRTDQTIESERQIDRINHQMRVERGINEARQIQRDAAACLYDKNSCR